METLLTRDQVCGHVDVMSLCVIVVCEPAPVQHWFPVGIFWIPPPHPLHPPHRPLPEREFPHFHNFIYVQSAAALLSPPINSSGNSVWRQSVSPWCVCGTRTMVRLLFLVLYASEFKLMISLKAIKKKKSCSAPCPCSEPALVNPQDVNDSRSGLCRLISKEAS